MAPRIAERFDSAIQRLRERVPEQNTEEFQRALGELVRSFGLSRFNDEVLRKHAGESKRAFDAVIADMRSELGGGRVALQAPSASPTTLRATALAERAPIDAARQVPRELASARDSAQVKAEEGSRAYTVTARSTIQGTFRRMRERDASRDTSAWETEPIREPMWRRDKDLAHQEQPVGRKARPTGAPRTELLSPDPTAVQGTMPMVIADPRDQWVPRPTANAELRMREDKPFTWEDFEHDVGLQMYRDRMERGRPKEPTSFDHMLAQLGVGWSGEQPVIATIRTMAKRYDGYMDALGVPRSERTGLAVPWVKGNKTGFTYVGHPWPKGAVPVLGIVPNEQFFSAQSRGGMTLGGVSPVYSGGALPVPISAAEHDLAHLTANMEYCWMTSHLRAASADIYKREASGERNAQAEGLWYDVLETMAVIPPERRAKLFSILELPSHLGEHPLPSAIAEHVRSMPPEARLALADRVATQALPLLLDLGGAARDTVNVGHSIPGLLATSLERARNPEVDDPFSVFSGRTPADVKDPLLLADVVSALVALSNITPERWIAEAKTGHLEPGSALRDVFVNSGAALRTSDYTPRTYFFERYRQTGEPVLTFVEGSKVNDYARQLLLNPGFLGRNLDFRQGSRQTHGRVEVRSMLSASVAINRAEFIEKGVLDGPFATRLTAEGAAELVLEARLVKRNDLAERLIHEVVPHVVKGE